MSIIFNTEKKEKELIQRKIIKTDKNHINKPKKKRKHLFQRQHEVSEHKSIEAILPYKDFVGKDSFIELENGFCEILQLQGYNLQGMTSDEIGEIIDSYEMLIKMYLLPIKVVTMYTPLDTSEQQHYYNRLANHTKNYTYQKMLLEQYYEFKYYGENNYNKEFYFFLYADTVQELREARSDFISYSGNLNIISVSRQKKISILYRLNNPTLTLEPSNFDQPLQIATQPIGNIRFMDSMTQTGNAYIASMYIYKFPNEPIGLWQSLLHNIPDSFVMVDIATQETGEVIQKLQRAIREQYGRIIEEKEPYEAMIAREEYEDLTYLGKALRQDKEVMKYMTVRTILFANTQEELERRIVEVRRYLEKNEFGATVLLLEQKEEYLSMFLDHTSQSYLPNKRVGRDVPSPHVATTFPANHVFMHDSRGQHLGYSTTKGNIIFDPFELNTTHRKHYNMIVLGDMGSGKSTLMKKMMSNMASKGYILRGFDKSGEYRQLIEYLNGKIIALDGTEGIINLFQVFPTVINDITNQVDEEASFTQHKSKLATWYATLKPSVNTAELDVFELVINELYLNFGFNPNDQIINYTHRANDKYPILEDFIKTVVTLQGKSENSPIVENMLEQIRLTMTKLLANYGQLFNGYTTIEKLQSEQILFFNIDGLMALDNKSIIDAQMFNALNLFWATLINHGKEQVRLYAKREIRFEDIKRSMLIIDEAHNQVNVNNPRQTKFINTMQREGRKMFIGVMLATQSLSTLAPEVMTDQASELLRDVYNFSQYRFFFKISTANVPHLKRLSRLDITEGQIDRIPSFPQGHCLLNISGENNIEFDVEVSEQELNRFSGGGKNVEDI